MEINDIREIEIFHTIEKIKEINEAIIFHQKFEEPDHFAIRQWQRVRIDLQGQLHEMLSALNVLPQTEATKKVTPKPAGEEKPKRRGMNAEQMAKIREARISSRAEAIVKNPKPKVEKRTSDRALTKRGASAEHIAKIREARMTKRAEASAINTVNPKSRVEKPAGSNAPKKRRNTV